MQSIQAHIKAINDLIVLGDRTAAVEQANMLLDRGDRHPFILSFLAHEALLQRDHGRAVMLSEEALQLSPDHLSLKRNLGIALLENGQSSRAIETFASLINAGQELPDLYHHLGSALHRAGQGYWSAVSFQKGLLIERAEQRLGVETVTEIDHSLRREGLQRVEAQLTRQLDQLVERTQRKSPGSVTDRVRRLCEQLCQNPAGLDALHLGRADSLLTFQDTLDWPVPLSRHSFSWLVQLEHRFVDLIEQTFELLQPDHRHHWIETNDLHGNAVLRCPLIVHGSKHRFDLSSVDGWVDQLQTILGQRISNLLPHASVIKVAPADTLELQMLNNRLMVSVVLPLIWPDGCQVGPEVHPFEQVVGRLIVPDCETLRVSNQSGRDAMFLSLDVAHPEVSEPERQALNAIVLEISSWLKHCETFSPTDLSLT